MDYEKTYEELIVSYSDMIKSYKELGLALYKEHLKICEAHGEEPSVEVKSVGIVFGSLE